MSSTLLCLVVPQPLTCPLFHCCRPVLNYRTIQGNFIYPPPALSSHVLSQFRSPVAPSPEPPQAPFPVGLPIEQRQCGVPSRRGADLFQWPGHRESIINIRRIDARTEARRSPAKNGNLAPFYAALLRYQECVTGVAAAGHQGLYTKYKKCIIRWG